MLFQESLIKDFKPEITMCAGPQATVVSQKYDTVTIGS
jgi:hypothetical protein